MNNSPRHFSCFSAEFPIRGIGAETRAWSTLSQRSTKMMRSSLVNVADFSVIFDDFSLKLLKNRDRKSNDLSRATIISASDRYPSITVAPCFECQKVPLFLFY
jgi:hypothetical protein